MRTSTDVLAIPEPISTQKLPTDWIVCFMRRSMAVLLKALDVEFKDLLFYYFCFIFIFIFVV
jgi:hypothetical protein